MGLHPYAPTIKTYKRIVTKIRGVLRKGGAGKKALWLDEVGWGSDKDGFSLNQGRRGQGEDAPEVIRPHAEEPQEVERRPPVLVRRRDPDPRRTVGCKLPAVPRA